jgi:succinoglycan biosynthesis protein ExoM
MNTECTHITVCICTFKRPVLLQRLLSELDHQQTGDLFSYSAVVADNDASETARPVVQSFRKVSGLDVRYCMEPVQNIALARNKAVENAQGDFIAFIDDDEYPGPNWLLELFRAFSQFKADGVLGPVLPYYETNPPDWIIKGRFYEKPSHKTGTVLTWTSTRTSNVMLRRDIFDLENNSFRREFGSGGEDRDFFRRMINQGFRFVWCDEAPVFEVVPPERQKRSFMLKRALLRGKIPYNQSCYNYIKSAIAIPLYTVLLPLLLFTRHHIFMKYVVRYCDHIGRILYLMGINIVKDKYVMK